MTEGIGKALASAIKDNVAPVRERQGRHIFLNQHRRDIFSKLTATPCIGIGRLASECGISQNTVEWHVETLIGSGYVGKHSVGRRSVFFPIGLISHEDIELFQFINQASLSAVLGCILRNPGLSLSGIADSAGQSRRVVSNGAAKLEAKGLITRVIDGASSRFYPTRLLQERAEGFYTHSKEFTDYILRKMEQEGGKPPIPVKKDLDTILVEMGYSQDRFTMKIGINPYMTCIVC